ncbi:helix-turn-helix domain-containing protein [Microbacterium sp. 18062]|uniref:helix-turn-helix domain-containing protein n=1 Tax=Microbacterium sp. 18062 TaxID=2681410 RepID=UPI001359E2C2|nr:helix-turn-helix domain-containing protein [Microbacterium sp. 18062]
MSREEDETETAESVLSKLLAGRSLLEVFTPRRETTALLEELRRDPGTRAILDGSRLDQTPPVNHDETDQPPSTPSRGPASPADEPTSDILRMVVDYANGMTQEEIARKHGLHIQTVRKRLTAAGVVTRSRSTALTAQDLDEARVLLDAGLSVREAARRLGVAHTTLLRAIRRAAGATTDENHHHAPRNE